MSPFVGSNILAGASGQGDASYKIEKSLRFNSADDSSLSRTFANATNRKIFTFSCWIKRTNVSGEDNILVAGAAHQIALDLMQIVLLELKLVEEM